MVKVTERAVEAPIKGGIVPGFDDEGVACYLRSAAAPGWVPLYRLYFPAASEDHFYTVDEGERTRAIEQFGYVDEGIAGFVSAAPAPGLSPLYRLYNEARHDHFYTASEDERDRFIATQSYRVEDAAGYVSAKPAAGLTPLYRSHARAGDNHFYTADRAELEARRTLREDTFCILPWKQLEVRREGHVDFCCKYRFALRDEQGIPLSIAQQPVGEIWNCSELRDVRRAMVQGERVRDCDLCYEREAGGFESDRMRATAGWLRGWLNPDSTSVAAWKARSRAQGFRDEGPSYIELRIGSVCNLMCRMCYPDTSTRIAADPVQLRWGGDRIHLPVHQWWKDRAVLERIFEHAEHIQQLYLLGGEPMLIEQVGDVLRLLVDRGEAKHIELEFSTNGSTARGEWLPLVREFKLAKVNFSIDGYDTVNEYIRHPLKWTRLVETIEALRKALPTARLSATAVFQAYNALQFVDLYRFCDETGLPLEYVAAIDHPHFLRTKIMPAPARRLAASRLRAYASETRRPSHRASAAALADGLESYGEEVDVEELRKFLAFTSDLDRSRGQSFRAVCPELWQAIVESQLVDTVPAPSGPLAALPLPPVELRARGGPADPEAWENPRGEAVFPGLPPQAGRAVFDFGCGAGRLARQLLQQRPGPLRYVGIDVDREVIDWCEHNLTPVAPHFTFLHHDVWSGSYARENSPRAVQPLPGADAQFSLVIASSIFTHLLKEQAEHYLREIARILAPDGVAVTTWFFFDARSFPFRRGGLPCLFTSEHDPSAAVVYDRAWFLSAVRAASLAVRSTEHPAYPGHQWRVVLMKRSADATDAFPAGDEDSGWLCGATAQPRPPTVWSEAQMEAQRADPPAASAAPVLPGAWPDLFAARAELSQLQERLASTASELSQAQATIDEIHGSRSWKLARAIAVAARRLRIGGARRR